MKTRPFIWIFILIISFVGLTSCSTIFSKIYGMKKTKPVDEKTVVHYSNKYNIPLEDLFELDTNYISFFRLVDSLKFKEERQNHMQPLQVQYYNKAGQFISYHVNCNAGGFPNLHWNRNNIMTCFPPQQQTSIDSLISLDSLISYFKPYSFTKKNLDRSSDFLIIIYWNRFMGRQSKRLIRIIQENSKLEKEKNIKIIYINNDNIYAGL